MTQYPVSSAERQDYRQAVQDEAIARVMREHVHGYYSMKCKGTHDESGVPKHRTADWGCLNDGSTCLCPCHDDQSRGA